MLMDVVWYEVLFTTVGGLGLFLIGMGMMSEGLKEVAGQELRKILESMTKQPLVGFGMGMFVTGLVQSSSATTVMVIGLVNAGLLTLRQSICVIFGANVGTTITAILGSISANIAGKRLAGAHLVFNLVTGLVALIFIQPLLRRR